MFKKLIHLYYIVMQRIHYSVVNGDKNSVQISKNFKVLIFIFIKIMWDIFGNNFYNQFSFRKSQNLIGIYY